MSKFLIKIKARDLRKNGQSIKDIAKILSVSPGSISLWCRDIKLTDTQITDLLKSKEGNITKGRLAGAHTQKLKRIRAIELATSEAERLKILSRNEYFIAGLALYLAEGSKKMSRVQFTNSDPRIINLMLNWFNKFYNITKDNIKCSVLINEIHRSRDSKIKKFWSKYLGIAPEKFTNIRYIKSKQKKIYSNHENYFGTFSFRVNKSTNLMYKLNALMDRMMSVV